MGSTRNLYFPVLLIPYIPQIENEDGKILSDTLNWMPVRGIFQAKGKEQYLIIGNFRNDEETKGELVNPNAPFEHGYYHIDNMSLIKVNCENYIVPEIAIEIYPNPTTEKIYIQINNQEFPTTNKYDQ